MCNPIKAIKKVFKKVIKHAKFIIPVVLGAAAIYFTAGAVLGGGAGISGLVGQLGLGSTLSSVLTGAVTQAGIGAALGAGTSLLTGGDIGKGALLGGAAGAVTGGITGAVNAPSSGATGVRPTAPSSATAPGPPINLVPSQGPVGVPLPKPRLSVRAPTDTGAASGGLLSGVGKFITDNQTLVGGALQGLGAGIGSAAEADARIEAARIGADQDEIERARIAANFDTRGGLLSGTTFDTISRPTPTQQFNPTTVLAKARGAMWRYNPETGQVELTTAA